MSNPWPERDYYESDESYIISMLKELFVELAQVKAMLEKPLYHITVPAETENPYESDPDLISNRGKP